MTTDNLPAPTFTGAELRARLDTSSTFLRHHNQEVRSLDSFEGAQGVAEGETEVDNRDVIQAAVDWSHATGGKVVIPPKVYGCDGDVQLKSYATLEGISKRMSKVRQLASTATSTMWSSNVAGQRPAFMTLSGFSIQGGRAPDWNTDNRDFTSPVVHIRGTLLGNGSYEPPDDPVALGREGVSFLADPHHRITNMVITDGWGDNLVVEGRGENVIFGNTIETAPRYGLHMASPDNWIGMNTIFKTGQSGIFCNQSNQRIWANKTWFYSMWAAEELFAAGLHFEGPGLSQISVNGHHVQDGIGPGYRLEGVGLILDGIVDKAAGGRVLSQGLGWQGAQTLRQSHVQVDNLKGSHVRLGFMNRGTGASPAEHIVNMNDSGADRNRIEIASYGETFDTAAPIRIAGGFATSKTHNVVMHNGEMLMGQVTAADLADPTHTINTGENRPSQVFLDTGRAALRVGDEWSLAPEGTVINPFDQGANVPAQMAAPSLVADSATQITATFAADPDDGGSAITGYDARYSTDEATWTTSVGATSPDVYTGLTAATGYFVQTRAKNAIGDGQWSASASVTTQAAPVSFAPASTGRLIQNTNFLADWSMDQPFIDVFRTSRRFPDSGTRDANGWPTEPGGYLLMVDQSAGSTTNTPLSGRYRIEWEGNGTVTVGNVSNQTSGTRFIEGDFTAGGVGIQINITATDPAPNNIRNITCVKTDNVAAHAGGAIFRPEWLAEASGLYMLRFMNWMATNGSTITSWSDRSRIGVDTWQGEGPWRGPPVEIMVEFCNQTGVRPWFCMPHQADDNYVQEFATYVRDNLNPDLLCAVEYSNEIWNFGFGFGQSTWVQQQAVADPELGDANLWMEWGGRRAAQMMDIWSTVFGAATAARVKRIAGVHPGFEGLEDQTLQAPNLAGVTPVNSFDAIATSGYFYGVPTLNYSDTGMNAILAVDTAEGEAAAVREIYDRVQADIDAGVQSWTYHDGVATTNSLELWMYEGGTHVALNGNSPARARELYRAYHQSTYYADNYRSAILQWETLTNAQNWAQFMEYSFANNLDRFFYTIEYPGQADTPTETLLDAYNDGTDPLPTFTLPNVPGAPVDPDALIAIWSQSIDYESRITHRAIVADATAGVAYGDIPYWETTGPAPVATRYSERASAASQGTAGTGYDGRTAQYMADNAPVDVIMSIMGNDDGGGSSGQGFITDQGEIDALVSTYQMFPTALAGFTYFWDNDANFDAGSAVSSVWRDGLPSDASQQDGVISAVQTALGGREIRLVRGDQLAGLIYDEITNGNGYPGAVVTDMFRDSVHPATIMRWALGALRARVLYGDVIDVAAAPLDLTTGLQSHAFSNQAGEPGGAVIITADQRTFLAPLVEHVAVNGYDLSQTAGINPPATPVITVPPETQPDASALTTIIEGQTFSDLTAQLSLGAATASNGATVGDPAVIYTGLTQPFSIGETLTRIRFRYSTPGAVDVDVDIDVSIPVSAAAAAPVITGVPTIAGTETEGETLTATPASVSGNPTPTRTWQWLRDAAPIAGATSATYVLVAADVGSVITVEQTETNSEDADIATSTATGAIAAAVTTSAPDAFAVGDWTVADTPATSGTVTVDISSLPANNGAAIDRIDYRIDAGAWVDSGVTTATTFDIPGLTDDVQVTVELRASNSVGDGLESDAKTVTSAAPAGGGYTPNFITATDVAPVAFVNYSDATPTPLQQMTFAARVQSRYPSTAFNVILNAGPFFILQHRGWADAFITTISGAEVQMAGDPTEPVSVLLTVDRAAGLAGGNTVRLQVKIGAGAVQEFTTTTVPADTLTAPGWASGDISGYLVDDAVTSETFADFFAANGDFLQTPAINTDALAYYSGDTTAAQINVVGSGNEGDGGPLSRTGDVVDAA